MRARRLLVAIVTGVVLATLLYVLVLKDPSNDGETGRSGARGGARPKKQAAADIRGSQDVKRMKYIKGMMRHTWDAYREHAWGCDELRPISQEGHNVSTHSLLLTPIDALDTLLIMDMVEEYREAKELILANFKMRGKVNLFETTIRVVGGLLGAYEIDKDERLVTLAKEVVDSMAVAFDTPTGMPFNHVNIEKNTAADHSGQRGELLLSEVTTIQLEYQCLSDVSGDPKYAKQALFALDQVQNMKWPTKGLRSKRFRGETLDVSHVGTFSYGVGGETDSYYEYLFKLYLSTGESKFLSMFEDSVEAMDRHMVEEILDSDTTSKIIYLPDITEFVGEDKVSTFRKDGIFSHLACYLGGLFGLAAEHVKRIKPNRMMTLAKGVTETCYRSYNSTATGIGPETFRITGMSPLTIQPYHSYYILRPEYVESLFYLWRLTHDEMYRERGWEVVQALERNCKADGGGYHSLNSVAYKSPDDRMESFFLAETLKYLYLLYTYDGVVPLEDYVFNTEAHALSKRGHGRREKTADLPKVPTTAADFWPMVVGKSRDDWGSGPAPLDIQE